MNKQEIKLVKEYILENVQGDPFILAKGYKPALENLINYLGIGADYYSDQIRVELKQAIKEAKGE